MAVRDPWNKTANLVEILEAAYRVEQSEEAWLGGVLDVARPSLDVGLGAMAYTYDASTPTNMQLRFVSSRDALPALVEYFKASVARMPANWVETNYPSKRTQVIRDMPGWETFMSLPARLDENHVVDDVIGINGLDPSLVGSMLGAYSSRRYPLTPRARSTWNRIGTHLAASFRLQRALQAKVLSAPTEAVLAPSGRVLHAEQPAQDRSTRDSLSEACQSIERARTRKGRADGEISLSLWRSLVAERWTLVDTYERDGKRYVVARRNDVRMPLPNALSPRERQALGFAALGDSNKLIAYELGISASTVGVLLYRAAQKLGCTSRVELLQRFRELLAAAPPFGPPKPSTH
jgi:DNA-binding CsgD family transcriptional regulator